MLLDYENLIESIPKETLYALVRDCVLSMGDFSNASPHDLDHAIEQTLQKIRAGKLLVEYGESSETFALVDKSKLTTTINK